MKLKFKYILLLSVLTTLTALFASFFAMSDNSGYAGLFFIGLSPIFIVVLLFGPSLYHLSLKMFRGN